MEALAREILACHSKLASFRKRESDPTRDPAMNAAKSFCVAALAPSLLARTFRGELVPQNPADEPAAVLLEQSEMQRKSTHESRPRKRR